MINDLCRFHTESEVGGRLDGPVYCLTLLLFGIVGFHLLHVLFDELIVFFGAALMHIVQHLPIAFHLFFYFRVTLCHRFHEILH